MNTSSRTRIARAIAVALAGAVILAAVLGIVGFSICVPELTVAVAGGIAYMVLCFRRPLWGICLLLFAQLYDQLLLLSPSSGENVKSFVNTLTVPKFMFVILVLMVVVRILLTKSENALRVIRSQALFLLLCAMFGLSWFPGLLNTGINGSTLLYMSRLVNGMALGLLTLALVDDFRSFRMASWALLVGVIGVAIMGLCEAATQTYVLTALRGVHVQDSFLQESQGGEGFRVMGPSGDPSYFSVQLLLGIVVAIIAMLTTRRRLIRFFCLIGIMLFFVASIPTGSRGGILSCALTVGAYFLLADMRHKLRYAVIAGVGCAIIVGAFVAIDPTALARFTGGGGASTTTRYRLGFIDRAFRMMGEHPVAGIGMGQFPRKQEHYFEAAAPRRRQDPSNVYLQIGAETGTISLAIYLAVLGLCCLHPLLRLLRARSALERNVPAAILSGILGLAFMAATANMREYEYGWVLLAFGVMVKDFHFSPVEKTSS